MSAQGQFPTLYLCKPGYEGVLREEMAAKRPQTGTGRIAGEVEIGSGWVIVQGAPPPTPFVFERQRIPGAEPIGGKSRRELAEAAVRRLLPRLRPGDPWTLHAFAPETSAPDSGEARVAAIGQAFLAFSGQAHPETMGAYLSPEEATAGDVRWVVQLALVGDALWGGLTSFRALSDPFPGGVHRMRGVVEAPSRSYRKILEALDLFGEQPRARQRVIDLGAAPGGWSLAFLQRGCQVIAVDRAELKLTRVEESGGRLVHLKEDGLRFRPPEPWIPVDWLVSDMLVSPGVTLGLLRKWAERGWMRRFIVNIKIPQAHPYPSLQPVERLLAEITAGSGRLRQLYHDRREVTAWGSLVQGTREARPGRPSRQEREKPRRPARQAVRKR